MTSPELERKAKDRVRFAARLYYVERPIGMTHHVLYRYDLDHGYELIKRECDCPKKSDHTKKVASRDKDCVRKPISLLQSLPYIQYSK